MTIEEMHAKARDQRIDNFLHATEELLKDDNVNVIIDVAEMLTRIEATMLVRQNSFDDHTNEYKNIQFISDIFEAVLSAIDLNINDGAKIRTDKFAELRRDINKIGVKI